ncbi:MAG: polysaccharide deacetylase family protein [Candidatus Omnitrophica bacterium]|nr:polysaccharide deacetylase family protein [Candidatus Omnitrophota bacterium]
MPERKPAKIRLRRWVGRAAFALGGRLNGEPAIRVLTYHAITDEETPGDWDQMTTPWALFAAQMHWLRNEGFRVIGGEEAIDIIAGRLPWPSGPSAMLTFDDGFRNYLTNAHPVLESLGFPSTVFIATDLVGRGPDRLTWDELAQLAGSNLVTVGSHAVTHAKLRGVPSETVRRELRESKRLLEERLGRPVTLFAYPYGSYAAFDASTVAAVAEEGYAGAFTTIAGVNRPGADRFRLRRTRISWADGLPEFRMAMAGAFDWYAGYQRLVSAHV